MSEGGASAPGGEADRSRDAAATLGGLEYLLPFAAAAASGVAREEWKHFRLARRADFEVRVIDGDWEDEGAPRKGPLARALLYTPPPKGRGGKKRKRQFYLRR